MSMLLPADVWQRLRDLGTDITPEMVEPGRCSPRTTRSSATSRRALCVTSVRQAASVVSHWQARHGRLPALAWVEGHNHISEIGSLGIRLAGVAGRARVAPRPLRTRRTCAELSAFTVPLAGPDVVI